ncbi:hypothetical protein TSUD_369750, partial [Trifolium subterraneum]
MEGIFINLLESNTMFRTQNPNEAHGPRSTWYVKELYFIAIRVLCNANISEHFNPKKDASFPEINLVTGDITGQLGGYPSWNRTILAFFAGHMNGKIRPVLFQHWKNKDKDMLVYEKVPENVSYHETMKMSKYCICPSGWEVASPRIVEAIYAECIEVSEIPKLKEILLGISEEKYTRLHEGVKQVQRHFVVNNPPKRYD